MRAAFQQLSRRAARALPIVSVALLALASGPARGQSDPKFSFGAPEAVKTVEWKAQAKGGFAITTGNSQTQNGNLTANVSRKEGNNKVALEGGVAYGRSENRTARPDPNDPTMYGVERQSVVSTNNAYGKGRYDRFFTANNAAYASGQAATDKVIGKSFFGGGQVGYSRQLLKTEMHLAVAELGYDLSYERYVQQTGKVLDPVSIHSARLFVGETLKLSAATGINASLEALLNLNKEGSAINVSTNQPGVGAFKDTRLLGKVGLTTTLVKQLSIGFGFTLKYDQNPATVGAPAGVPAGLVPNAPYFFAEKVDTLTEVTLIMTFL
jgi:hypothetical protein